LEGGRARFFDGPWHAWRKEKAARELALGRAIERQQAEIDRLDRFVTRFRAGTRARQAQSRAKKLAKIDRVQRGAADGASLSFAFKPPERSGRVVFELENGQVSAGDKALLEHAELWLERGEHVSLVGPNGAGKTTLIETLAGRRGLPAGKLRTGHNVKLGYLSQHADELATGTARTVVEATTHLTGLTPNRARALLGQFMFSGDEAEKPLEGLSGGERRRLSLAILVNSGANVLILDEPTNHLDLESREALEEALGSFEGSLLLVSHDRALLDAVGSRTVAIEDRALHSYVGGWPEYVRVRDERAAAGAPGEPGGAGAKSAGAKSAGAKSSGATASPSKASGAKASGPNAGSSKAATTKGTTSKANAGQGQPDRRPGPKSGAGNAKAQRQLEREIEAAESALRALEQELSDPSAWADASRSADSTSRHSAAKQAVESLYARWERVAG
ncbi:MAG TPA: ATP-binding cassette domain-containing protein, partial [Solirubrobacteraceae bacterium]|nr:ATP-binding cassette domain-containing protein [Solirubrobacteraceae bacterium]